ncbi:MAG: hypothetical protein COB38_04480 [Gammaproteobacteria bacterium]|nr:MAG: hypothetical protein COB38_04480 [Gammaproteobacteria bacterium]
MPILKLIILALISTSCIMNVEAEDSFLNLDKKPKIAIVIDDLGDNLIIAKKIIALQAKLTLGILPQTPQSKEIAELAYKQGHEIILHLPMEAHTRPDLLGPGALYSSMSFDVFLKTFRDDIASIPYISGFNNHMGSLLTEDKLKMEWIMDEAKNHSLYFLDSKTSGNTIAKKIAIQKGIKSLNRDVFLDHSTNRNNMMLQLKHLKFIAKRNGQAVLICHPYPETLAFLQESITLLDDEFKLVVLSELLEVGYEIDAQPSLAK